MAGTIGIKIANGEFYPLMEENLPATKKLVLTTVHDGQKSVQIDLFRSISKTMLDAQYMGSIVVENLRPKLKGEPSIEMVISSDINGNISADAIDIDPGVEGEHHTLNVSLSAMDGSYPDDNFNDFDLEYSKPPSSAVLYGLDDKPYKEERKFPWMVMALATLFVILAISALWFFFLGGRDTIFAGKTGPLIERTVSPPAVAVAPQPVPAVIPPPVVAPPPQVEASPVEPVSPAESVSPTEPAVAAPVTPPPVPAAQPVEIPPPVEPAPLAEPASPSETIPVIRAPATPPAPQPTVERTRPPAPVSSYRVPAVIPAGGTRYMVQWGDTLWDISEAFYRDPWLYHRIAQHNNIKNPDFILSGFYIRIPPRN